MCKEGSPDFALTHQHAAAQTPQLLCVSVTLNSLHPGGHRAFSASWTLGLLCVRPHPPPRLRPVAGSPSLPLDSQLSRPPRVLSLLWAGWGVPPLIPSSTPNFPPSQHFASSIRIFCKDCLRFILTLAPPSPTDRSQLWDRVAMKDVLSSEWK